MHSKKHNPKRNLLLILTFFILNSAFYICTATVRYVSHSGSNTPPYTSWATAADSIMSAINISVFGDTIYVANGVYKERIDLTAGLTLIGAGMDSCIIDSREFTYVSGFYTVKIADSCQIGGFNIITYDATHGFGIYIREEAGVTVNSQIFMNKIQSAVNGIRFSGFNTTQSNTIISNNLILDVADGINCMLNRPTIVGNYIYANEVGLASQISSSPTYLNNTIVLDSPQAITGFGGGLDILSVLKNNLFYIGDFGADGIRELADTVINNVVYGDLNIGIRTQDGGVIKNNVVQGAQTGIDHDASTPLPLFQYNDVWGNELNYKDISPDSTNISVDPMVVNEDSMDFHLQMFSPLIDAGDPNILDLDGSRSDIGLWGGPYGEMYTYRDLAPKPPSNLTAEYDSGLVKLTWNKNTEADFYHYRVYRDTVPNFMYDTTKIIAVVADTFYYDSVPEKFLAGDYYYKLTALDSAGHQSAPSEEVHINITGIPEAPPVVVEHYQLLNNYPNPFNSSTIIPYRLKKAGYVKLYVYDIKGELIRVLVNEYQQKGYYELKFSPSSEERKQGEFGDGWWTGYNDDIATGIYIYQIMVRGEGNIPVFTDMGKMILLK